MDKPTIYPALFSPETPPEGPATGAFLTLWALDIPVAPAFLKPGPDGLATLRAFVETDSREPAVLATVSAIVYMADGLEISESGLYPAEIAAKPHHQEGRAGVALAIRPVLNGLGGNRGLSGRVSLTVCQAGATWYGTPVPLKG